MNWKYIGFIIIILACQVWTVHSQCQQVNSSSGIISDSYKTDGSQVFQRCWKIAVQAHHFINATIELPQFLYTNYKECDDSYVEVEMDNFVSKKFCKDNKLGDELFFPSGKNSFFKLTFYVKTSRYMSGYEFRFRLKYLIQPTILGVSGIKEARENGVNWLKRRQNPYWGWKEDTPRAIMALFLSGTTQFNGSLTEEIMAKQAELRTSLSLTWNSVSIESLSTSINALLTICMKPRHFYGHDLVAKLQKQVESSGNFTHPAAYLALCNANESWPNRSASDLSYVLSSESDYRFIRDLQAFAIMALSCEYNRRNLSTEIEDRNLRSLYFEAIKRMKGYQLPDGSFGNPHTTALFTQALKASHQEFSKDWRLNDNINYLMKKLNSSEVNFLTVYATLPLLNGKTLVDIAHMNCTENPRFEGEDPASELRDNQGPKIRVQYSLYIGDQKDVIHTISLRVPKDSSAYKIMEFAEWQNKKYEFKVETIDNVKHVYEIADLPNDPESGKFWLMYVKHRNTDSLSRYTSNPETLILEDEEHLVMWYETQKI